MSSLCNYIKYANKCENNMALIFVCVVLWLMVKYKSLSMFFFRIKFFPLSVKLCIFSPTYFFPSLLSELLIHLCLLFILSFVSCFAFNILVYLKSSARCEIPVQASALSPFDPFPLWFYHFFHYLSQISGQFLTWKLFNVPNIWHKAFLKFYHVLKITAFLLIDI